MSIGLHSHIALRSHIDCKAGFIAKRLLLPCLISSNEQLTPCQSVMLC